MLKAKWCWPAEIPMLTAPGIYRVELFIDTSAMWRGFVRITP